MLSTDPGERLEKDIFSTRRSLAWLLRTDLAKACYEEILRTDLAKRSLQEVLL